MEKTGFSGADFLLGLAKEQVDEIVKRGNFRDPESGTVLFRQGIPRRNPSLF